jgi:hypothetical protein
MYWSILKNMIFLTGYQLDAMRFKELGSLVPLFQIEMKIIGEVLKMN